MSIHIRFRVGLSGYRRYKYAPESTRFSNLSEKDTYMCTIYIELTRKLHLPKTEESSSWHCMKKEKKQVFIPFAPVHLYIVILSAFPFHKPVLLTNRCDGLITINSLHEFNKSTIGKQIFSFSKIIHVTRSMHTSEAR
jgi:hypothetical protein